MIRKSHKLLISLLFLALAAFPDKAIAVPVVYNNLSDITVGSIDNTRVFSLDQFNETIPGFGGGVYDYGFVAISKGSFTHSSGTYEFRFTVDALTTDQTSEVIEGKTYSFNPLFVAGGNFGVQEFAFNDPSDSSTAFFSDNDFLVPDDKWGVNFNANISKWGVFDNDLAGTGSTRKDPLIIFLDDSSNTLTIDDFLCLTRSSEPSKCQTVKDFTAHIAGFNDILDEDDNNVSSGFASGGPEKVGITETPVPEPTTVLLLGSGLLGLLGLGRRQFLRKKL